MRTQQHRRAGRQRFDQAEELPAAVWVHARGRLVEQQQLGTGGERERGEHLLPLAARQGAERALRQHGEVEVEHRARGPAPAARCGRAGRRRAARRRCTGAASRGAICGT
jgi:hypothetical protein